MVGLGNLPGDDYWGLAWTVSRDGCVILGYCRTQPGYYEAFIWDGIHQMRNLKHVFETDYGLDLSDWRLTDARGISADGLRIAGTGVNPDGITEAWLFVIPEPCTLLLLSMGAVGLVAYAWRRGRRR